MVESLSVLIVTTISIALFHTIIGPDHYLPFILLGKSNKWSFKKTLLITFVCGVGHCLSSVLIGLIGIAIGAAVGDLEGIESIRGEIASWSLIIFGVVYGIWGLYHARKHPHHTHAHVHMDGSVHTHDHKHEEQHHHVHLHEEKRDKQQHNGQQSEQPNDQQEDQNARHKKTAFWSIFVIFVLGPCEPLIPLVMFPAIYYDWGAVVLVSLVFSSITIGTMLLFVGLASYGLMRLNLSRLERYSHALAGGIIAISGLLIIILGV